MEHLLTIIHISDMHLYVDEYGDERPPGLQNLFFRWFSGFLHQIGIHNIQPYIYQLNGHDPDCLDALRDTLLTLCSSIEVDKLVIVQTGDMEALGGDIYSNGPMFHSYDFWDHHFFSACGVVAPKYIFDIYGNHDIWPDRFPFIGTSLTVQVEQELRTRPKFINAMPTCMKITTTLMPVEFFSLNTVFPRTKNQIFSIGELDTDYPIAVASHGNGYPNSHSNDPIIELESLAPPLGPTNQAVRIIFMHHPPHFFRATGLYKDRLEGPLIAPAKFYDTLTNRFHLILAGHRHEIDPAEGVTFDASKPGSRQYPLPANVIQLVAGSPTQDRPGASAPSFSTYKLSTDRTFLKVERNIYRYEDSLSSRQFTKETSETIVENLKIIN
jgi:hypothetical protein